jgi:hypothetical protein
VLSTILKSDPAAAAQPMYADEHLDQMLPLYKSCSAGSASVVAQVGTSPSPASSSSPQPAASAVPSASPSPQNTPGIPPVPSGPQVLIAPTPPNGIPTPPPPPTPSPQPSNSPGPIFLTRPSGTPGPLIPKGDERPSPSPTPSGVPTLEPGEIAVIADDVRGARRDGVPGDAYGNVNILYAQGRIVGQHAHYDGSHTITMTGNPYIIDNINSAVLYGDQIDFDTRTQKAVLVNGRGETTEGVEQGKFYYRAKDLTTNRDGTTHGDRAWMTTCQNARGGYHIESKTVDVEPNKRIIIRHAVVYLGALAVFYWPLLIIPLRVGDLSRRRPQFLPVFGYDSVDGAWVKARLGFGTTDYYYGYYTVNFFTRRGLGLGYTAFISAKNGVRVFTIDSYEINDRVQNERLTNINITDTENISRQWRAQAQTSYNSNFGPNISLPAAFNFNGSVIHTDNSGGFQNVTFQRFVQGDASDQTNLAFIDQIVRGEFTQGINLSYTDSKNFLADSSQFHMNFLSHWDHGNVDYTLTYDKTDTADPFGYDTIPELKVIPKINFHNFAFPFQIQFSIGDYSERQNGFNTMRFDTLFAWPVYFKILNSDVNYTYTLDQDYYATGDEKALATQQGSLTTPISTHAVNTLSYNEQNPIGPADVPFQLLDRLSSGSHALQDVIRIFNKDVYALTLNASTYFNEEAQPIGYSLVTRPSLRSSFLIGGNWQPGPGNGFASTNLQWITPLGKYTDAQFVTNIDWKNKGRLENKSLFLHQIIGNCYEIRATYNEDLKTYAFEFNLLAFPSRGANFGLNGPTTILPQNFAF